MSKNGQPVCEHRQTTVAKDVSAHIDVYGCLRGGDGYMGPDGKWIEARTYRFQRYERLAFCSNRGCEKVFEAVRAK